MTTKINENRDEEEILDEAAEDIEDDNAEGDEGADADQEEDKEPEADQDEDADQDDDADDVEDKPGKKEKEFVMPEKFKGKTAEEIAKAYQHLEGMTNEKAIELAQKFLTKKDGDVEVKPEDADEEFDLGLTDEQIATMTPKEFAKHMGRKITERATEIARNAIERSNEVKENVSREIRDATKAHPHLKENKEYRDIVLSVIEANHAKGKILTLKEACEKTDKALGIKPASEKKEAVVVKKKVPTEVEKNDGQDGGKTKTDEDRVKEGMMNAGRSFSGPMGGLGV